MILPITILVASKLSLLKRPGFYFLAAGLIFITANQAMAESAALTEGIAAFKDGDYKQAESRLGCAQAAEFSNPVFHYYMANTYIKVNKKELAIQEYRIAFALAPEKEVGKLSRQALVSLGLEPEEKKETKAEVPKAKPTAKDIALENAKSSLQHQVDAAKDSMRSKGERDAMENARVHSDAIARAQKELEDNIRKGKATKDTLKQLEELKKYYDSQRTALERGNTRAQEIQRSADNLQNLLDEKKTIGTMKLSPVGTNLYVRNYADGSGTTSSSANPNSTSTGSNTHTATSASGTGSSAASSKTATKTTTLQTTGKVVAPTPATSVK